MESTQTGAVQVAGTETDTAVAQTAGTAQETTEVKANPYDWWNPDTWGEKQPKEVVSEIQRQYNEVVKSKKESTTQLEASQKQYNELVHEAQTVIQRPDLYDLYRQKMNLQPVSAVPPKAVASTLPMVELTPEMSVKDAQDKFNTALQERDKFHGENTKRAVTEAINTFRSEIAQEFNKHIGPIQHDKWKSAMESAHNDYGPEFGDIRPKLVAYIEGPYAKMYTNGNERGLIDRVFRAEFPEEYQKVIFSKAGKEADTRAAATTAGGSRAVRTLPTDMSDASCIERAEARAEAMLRAKGLI